MPIDIHSRVLPTSVEHLGELLETLASADDQIWCTDVVPPMALDNGLNVGSRGGHGDVRYRVLEHDPGKRVRFVFDPVTMLAGWHEFEVLPVDASNGQQAILKHTLNVQPKGAGHIAWRPIIKPIHSAALEDMLSHLDRSLGGTQKAYTVPLWIKLAARMSNRRWVERGNVDVEYTLDDIVTKVDAADCFRTPLLPADSRDPEAWARAVLVPRPGVVSWLMRARNILMKPFGLKNPPSQLPSTGFPLLKTIEDGVVLGVDDRHLSFRLKIDVARDSVGFTTVVKIHNTFGKLYWSVVSFFHPLVVKSMMKSAKKPVR